MGEMSLLLTFLLLAPDPVAVKVPELQLLLKGKKPKTDEALTLLKQIGQLKGNDTEAKALVKLIRSSRVKKPPEIMEASFLALKGIGSRKVTKSMLALLNVKKLKKDSVVRVGICRALEGSADPAGWTPPIHGPSRTPPGRMNQNAGSSTRLNTKSFSTWEVSVAR